VQTKTEGMEKYIHTEKTKEREECMIFLSRKMDFKFKTVK
jgi:hypothetical protein